ncbi:MAG: CDP-alcohol phosphatidyltransferase family protein [Kiloniellales bacterium]
MSHNTWIHRIARVAVRPLVQSDITPNQVTTLRLGAGIAAAGAFALGNGTALAWGAGIFVVSMVLDRADGELARLSGKTSAWGHKYDLVSDAVCNALAFVGLGIGLRDSSLGLWALPMGLDAGLAIALILWLIIKMERAGGERAGELPGLAGFDADDAMLLVPLAIWLGLAQGLLIAAAVGAPLFALLMYLWLRRRPAGDRKASASKRAKTRRD